MGGRSSVNERGRGLRGCGGRSPRLGTGGPLGENCMTGGGSGGASYISGCGPSSLNRRKKRGGRREGGKERVSEGGKESK